MNTFKEFEATAWERKADRYDETWGSVTSQSIEAALDMADVDTGTILLDAGCGPGHLCFQALQRGAVVTGCDYSHTMLRIAQSLYPHINFCHGDAEALPFESNVYDAVILNYLLLHVANPDRALREAQRVLKPGGKLVFTLWLPPEHSPGLDLIFAPLKQYADWTVIPPAQDLFLLASPTHAREHLIAMGFLQITTKIFQTAWRLANAESFFEAVQAGTRMGGMVELQRLDVREKIRSSVMQAIEQYREEERYSIPTPSLIVSATKTAKSTHHE